MGLQSESSSISGAASPAQASTEAEATPQVWSNYRWVICALLFFSTTINYLDRQVLSLLEKTLETSIGLNSVQYGRITGAFLATYAIGLLGAGYFIDRFGTRKGYSIAISLWSLAGIATAAATSALTFGIARGFLGLGEAANFPACIKSVAEWFPKRERALATGIFNAGSNIGIIIAAMVVVRIAAKWHWQSAFIITGVCGFIWLFLWVRYYRSPDEHPNLARGELDLIRSDNEAPEAPMHVPWTSLLRYRQAWAFLLGKMLTDPVWWFYLTRLPTYLVKERNMTPEIAAWMTIVPFLAADVGSIGGGWLSGFFMKRGWPVGRARFTALAIAAVCMPGAIWAVLSHELFVALTLISLATAAHQAWSANLFTIASDMFPKKVVGSVVGLGGMAGAIGGMFMQLVAGGLLQSLGTYVPLFIIAGVMHPLAL